MADGLRCPQCSRELPGGFPGAAVTCVCGATTMLPAVNRAARDQARSAPGGPYRGAVTPLPPPREIECPYCGNTCLSTVRVCPHCDVRFDSVRCDRCYTLQPPGAFACVRCDHALELQPLLDATDAPCPRCAVPLETAGGSPVWADARLHECPRCDGMFVPREALADILSRAEQGGPFPAEDRQALKPLDEVKYLPCPLCHTPMNRLNFGKVSGVIVDVCRRHGTWFDGGELTRVVAFAASGGLEKTRSRERQEKELRAREQVNVQRELAIFQARTVAAQRVEEWRLFLDALFFW